MKREHRVAGAVIGSAVGDALGAPFEFGRPNQFSIRFPTAARGTSTEMCGGGAFNWRPGEFTDDTQMALAVADSLLRREGLDEADIFEGFKAWAGARPSDIGAQTAAILFSGSSWSEAARNHFASGAKAAGNGSLMRATPAAVYFARGGQPGTMDAARRISVLTHGDPAASEGCAIFHELVRAWLEGEDAIASIPQILEHIAGEQRQKWADTLSSHWTPDQAAEPNGAVWPTLGTAVWALRHAISFEEALRSAIDVGGDTDTIGAVTGALAGAKFGIARIPMRWTSALQGGVPGHGDTLWRLPEFHHLATSLDGEKLTRHIPAASENIEPAELAPGVWASDLDGARRSDLDFAVISLCRTGDRFPHEIQRFAFLSDDDSNSEIDSVLEDILSDIAALRNDGRRVLVHCFGGASRTGLVLRAWLRRTEGLSPERATARILEAWPHLGLWNSSFTAALARLR